MKFTGISNSYIYITSIFLCMELCYCIWIDRKLQDIFQISHFKEKTCDPLNSDPIDANRCKCRKDESILVSNKGESEIICLGHKDFSGGCVFKNSTTNTSVKIAGALATCNNWTFTTEFWNLENDNRGSNEVRGKWQIHNHITTYVTIENNIIVFESPGNLFTGMLLRMNFRCQGQDPKCVLIKIYGNRTYPISTNSIHPFSTTTKTPTTTTATTETRNGEGSIDQPSASTKNTPIAQTVQSNSPITQNSTATMDKKNESSTIPRNTSSNIPNAHMSSKEDSKNVVTIAVVASLVTMINIILSICLIKRLRQKHKNGEYKVDDRTEQMKGQTDEPIYAEANNNFSKKGSPKKEQNDPSDRQKFVAARINLQKIRAYQNFTNEDMEHEDSQTDLPDYDEPENDFQMIHRYENFPREDTPEEQLKNETQPRYVNSDSNVVKNDGYVIMKSCTAESNSTEQMTNQTDCQVHIQEQKNLQNKLEYEISKDEKAPYLSNSSPISTEEKPEYSELTAQIHGKTLLYTRLSINNPAFTEEPYYRCVDEAEVEESSSTSSDIYYHSVEEGNTTADEQKLDYTDLDPQYQYKYQEYTDLCLDNLGFIEEPVYRCVDESD